MEKSSIVRVKRKGQVTIPSELREELGLEEGSMVMVRKEKGGLLIRAVPPIRAGRVVGREEYDRLLADLDESRRNWRRQE